MTFQLNFEDMTEDNDRLQFTYSIDGELPVAGYRLQDLSFTSAGYNFDIKYSITGDFVVETEPEYLKRLQDIGTGLAPAVANPIDPLHDRIHRMISEEFARIKRNLSSSQTTLDDLSN